MQEFESNYEALNDAQRQAVDTVEGPVMVVAGPGTGKTQLLSMRVANILRKTDVQARNILCLTFTESGATAMRERLAGLIGQQAYAVAIHTFHSFGAEIINTNPDYFYQGAHFKAADELSSYQILEEIFDKLQHDNPLTTKMNGEYTALRDTQKTISELKKASLTSDELLTVIEHNDSFINFAEPLVDKVFGPRLSKKIFPSIEQLLLELSGYKDIPVPIIGIPPLSEVMRHSLETALEAAVSEDSTKPIGEWRSSWLEKNEEGGYIFKDSRRHKKLRAVSGIYYDYLLAMQKRALFDFDDMILRVVHAMEVFNDLRLNLQEQYQYILVDEFQDTNGAQMRMLWNLTNNEVSAGRPNILVVGDDDQAIYRFQGADLSNILSFSSMYKDPVVVTLTDNYRSTQPILDLSRNIITQAKERLEHALPEVDKTLKAQNEPAGTVIEAFEHRNYVDENMWIARRASEELRNGAKPGEIAIIGRNHAELKRLMPYLHEMNLPIQYERQDNILDSPPILALQQLADMVVDMSEQRFDEANAALPQVLAHPAWNIPAAKLWEVSIKAHKEQKFWLEVMLENRGKLKDIAEWLIYVSQLSLHEPLERMVDILLGTDEVQPAAEDYEEPTEAPLTGPLEEFHSPLRAYFFSKKSLEKTASDYISYLGALTTIRRQLRDYQPDRQLTLRDFCSYIQLHRAAGIGIPANSEFQCQSECIQVMTAHKSKGLEFKTVFIQGLTDSVWGTKSKGRGSSIGFPHNMALTATGDLDDERLRLLFVAMTRAKRHLYLSWHQLTHTGKEVLPAAYITQLRLEIQHPEISTERHQVLIGQASWHESLSKVPQAEIKDLLEPVLKTYKLSATHINNFVDVSQGGPQAFLLQNLLRFPQVMSPSAAYGSAIHATLQRAHTHLKTHGKRKPVEDVLRDFEQQLESHRLSQRDYDHYLMRGSDALNKFLEERYDSFDEKQVVERNFAAQGVIVDGVPLTGAIDLLDIDEKNKTIRVTDYKTGKYASRWLGYSDFEKIKLHKYRQQLMLYKILVENSREYGGKYRVDTGLLEFVEPAVSGRIIRLELAFDEDEINRFKKLICSVWKHIRVLDLPETTQYEPNIKGILKFEEDLISEL